ncbi:MAG: NAD(P)H-dependent flavin oxidoreductase, partial [Neobacillus sp.]
VVVQGTEAGGHRGTFIGDAKQSLIGLMSLVPQVADCIRIPVIAAGGIMDGRGILAVKCLGALGVQMGTAFLVCQESGANTAHKEAIIKSNEEQAVLTKAFSGKMARGFNNQFIEKMNEHVELLPEYPLQNELTKGIRKASAAAGNPEFMSLWGGQSPRLAKKQTVQELMSKIVLECEKIGEIIH